MTETNETAYLARSMPVNEDEPIYAFRIGETIQAAKDAIEDATQERAPAGTVHNLAWNDSDSHNTVSRGESHGWYFQVDEYDFHQEE